MEGHFGVIMQNIKLFKEYEPGLKQRTEDFDSTGGRYRYLMSEDGQDWYECQSLFSDDTVKVMYDANNVIRSVVDKPVPQRGNTYAVSMLFPDNMSVAEIEGTLPDGFEIESGTWLFDGDIVYQDADLLAGWLLRKNKASLLSRLSKTAGLAFAIQSSAAIGHPREGDDEQLLALQQHADSLRDVDLTSATPAWPPLPAIL